MLYRYGTKPPQLSKIIPIALNVVVGVLIAVPWVIWLYHK